VKKMVPIILILLPFVSMADTNLDLRNQMLDSEIEKYIKTRDEKYAALQQCEKTTQGFKIAGITTLVATGVGVYGNIKLAQKAKGKSGSGGGGTSHLAGGSDGHETLSELELECRDYSKMTPEDCAANGVTVEQVNSYCAGTGYSIS
jgi:hypothetical protein